MRYFIADLHNGDENIITYSHRPFKTVKEMKDEIVHNWNSVIEADDEIYLLGDIGELDILLELKGKITIVCGNHDDFMAILLFVRKNKLGHIYVSKTGIFLEPLLLTHEPVTFLPKEFPYLNIHGHIHDMYYGIVGKWNDGRRHFNVSCEALDYMPISEEEICKELEYRPVKN